MTQISRAARIGALSLLLAGCASASLASPSAASTDTAGGGLPAETSAASIGLSPASSPRSPTSTPPTASVPTVMLEGTILYNRDTFYIANADWSDARRLAEPGRVCCLMRISPDHSRILTMPGDDQAGAVRGGTLTLEGSEFELLPWADETLNLVPQAWSPDGTRIAFEGWDERDPSRTGVYTARASDGGDLVRVTARPGLPHDTPLDYSPDGKQLVFHRALKAEPETDIDLGGSLWVVDVDGSGAHQLSTGEAKPWWGARWSPDGSKILFGVERRQGTGALWTIGPDGSGLTKLFEDPAGRFALGPVWSPDGSKIMFSLNPTNDAFEHPDNAVYVVDDDGSKLTFVIGGPGYKGAAEWWEYSPD